MGKNSKVLGTVLMALVIIASLLVSGSETAAATTTPAKTDERADWPKTISFAGGPSSSGSYARVAGLSAMINKYLNVTCAPEAAGVPHAQLMAMSRGKVEMSYPFLLDAKGAYFGSGDWTAEPLNIRVVLGAPGSAMFIGCLDKSDIVDFKDLRGKKVVCKPPSTDWWAVAFVDLLEAHGMTLDDITPLRWTSHGEMLDLIDAGAADAAISGNSPAGLSPAYLEQDVKDPLRVINIDPAILEKVSEKWGDAVFVGMYPGGKFKSHPDPFPVLTAYQVAVASADLPESFIYEFMKMSFTDHNDEYLAVGRGIQIYNLENTIQAGQTVPLHDGVVKYLKEIGLWTDELDAKQTQLVQDFGSGK